MYYITRGSLEYEPHMTTVAPGFIDTATVLRVDAEKVLLSFYMDIEIERLRRTNKNKQIYRDTKKLVETMKIKMTTLTAENHPEWAM